MDRTLELAAVEGLARTAGEAGPATPAHTHTTCLNCGAHLHGRFCHDCGQGADDHHRSIGHLLWEAVEGFTHLDGRLGQTLPPLLFNPGRLARDHIEGRRQRHVPPFRLFLITLLIFMFAAELAIGHGGERQAHSAISSAQSRHEYQVGKNKVVVTSDMAAAQLALQQAHPHSPFEAWLGDHLGRALGNREYFTMLVFEWAHRLAVLLLPILAGFLALLYVRERRLYVYDHLVVAMQYLSFCFLLWAVIWLLPHPLRDWAFFPALAWTPFNLYLVLRGAYGSGRLGAAAKAAAVWLFTVAAFGALLMGLLGFALNAV